MKKYRQILIALSFVAHIGYSYSQTILIENIALANGDVKIRYDLQDSISGRYYTVRLYSSEDNYLNPLKELSGDVGMEVPPGDEKTLIWHAKNELGSSFSGDVSLELRARVYIPFIDVADFSHIKTLTRHRKHSITWSGGRPSNILNFNLYRGEEKVTTFSNIANVGHHDLELPAHIKPGKGYYFLISDSKNKDEVVKTTEFKIRRKVPLLLKAIPVFALAGTVFILSSSEGEAKSPIPDPPTLD